MIDDRFEIVILQDDILQSNLQNTLKVISLRVLRFSHRGNRIRSQEKTIHKNHCHTKHRRTKSTKPSKYFTSRLLNTEQTCSAESLHLNCGMSAFTPDLRTRRMRNSTILFWIAFRPQTSLAYKRSKGNDATRRST